MTSRVSLVDLLEESARRFPDRTAVKRPGESGITYAELSALSDALRDRLWHLGVRPGDRVGFRLHKSEDGIATIFGILKAGAAYVPVDAESPPARGAYILNNCDVKVVVTEQPLAAAFTDALAEHGASPAVLALDTAASQAPLRDLLASLDDADPADGVPSAGGHGDALAYILYTSGSTGNPKGVALSHGNALSFVDWCTDTFGPTENDRFSSHAPFHFDLSILDIYLCIKHGAALVLIDEKLGKDPLKLAAAIAEERISIWYSTPSILSLLANYGKLDKYDYSALRMVFFAGEVFPIPQYLGLHARWPEPRYFNLYGPTETNVCTWYEVPRDDARVETMSSFPIGPVCEPNLGMAVDEQDRPVEEGEDGELLISGPNVMQGYWNLPDMNERAFFRDDAGRAWYRTGDIVRAGPDGYVYVSRRDRMVKRRGYRVELGEVEVALQKNPAIREAAVVAVPDAESGVRICAAVGCKEGQKTSVIELKTHCARNLPPYMIPDVFTIVDRLPRTSTDKLDYQALKSRFS